MLDGTFCHGHIDDFVPGFGLLEHGGFNQTRGNRVDGDAERSQLLCHGLGVADDAGLGGGIIGLSEFTAQSVDGCNVDDTPILLLFENRRDVTGEVEIPFEVDLDDPVPLRFGHFPAHTVPVHTGVVNQDFKAAEFLNGRRNDLLGFSKR